MTNIISTSTTSWTRRMKERVLAWRGVVQDLMEPNLNNTQSASFACLATSSVVRAELSRAGPLSKLPCSNHNVSLFISFISLIKLRDMRGRKCIGDWLMVMVERSSSGSVGRRFKPTTTSLLVISSVSFFLPSNLFFDKMN